VGFIQFVFVFSNFYKLDLQCELVLNEQIYDEALTRTGHLMYFTNDVRHNIGKIKFISNKNI
jgi:hypothetical protein